MSKSKNHYIDNEKFYEEMCEWVVLVKEAEASEEPRPPINNYIGKCFLDIASNLCKKGNFAKYPYTEEMVSDAVENCLMYAHNFNPEKSKNPFSYFTQIIYFAFLRRIEKEKKQMYIKYKLMEENDVDGTLHKWYKQNYFEKDKDKTEKKSVEVVESTEDNVDDIDIKDVFDLTDGDITKFSSKKKKT